MRGRAALAGAGFIVVAASVFAQAPQPPAFAVASVKPNRSGLPYDDSHDRLDGLAMVNEPLRDIITFAFDLYDFQLAGAPDWVSNERFDIAARAEKPLSTEEKRVRLQRVLADRFRLHVHYQSREQATYRLIRVKPAAGLTPRDCARPGIANLACGQGIASPDGGIMRLAGVPITRLARFVGGVLGRAVTDESGLSGVFDIDWQWRPDIGLSADLTDAAKARIEARPSLPVALREQLGLDLVPSRGTVEVLVVDHVERPTGN